MKPGAMYDQSKKTPGNTEPVPGNAHPIKNIEKNIDLPDPYLPNRNIGKEEWDHKPAPDSDTTGDQYYPGS